MSLDQYGEDVFRGTARLTATWHDHLLVQQWLPLVPGLVDRLAGGVRVLDIGCGQGRAIIRMATVFPASRFVGVDVFPPAIEAARQAAETANLADRVQFEIADAAGVDGEFELITTFDVVHDAADPAALLGAIRGALRPDGVYLMLEMNCQPTLEENVGPLGTIPLRAERALLSHDLARGGWCGAGDLRHARAGCPPHGR